jgi:hypothetical protein
MSFWTEATMSSECGTRKPSGSQCNMLWFLGMIGAAIYFIGNAEGFWAGVLGFLKALIWPVFVVMKLLEFLKL